MKTYAIHWISTTNGKIGKGTRLFEKEEAERIAAELNRDYPDIEHEVVALESDPAESAEIPMLQVEIVPQV